MKCNKVLKHEKRQSDSIQFFIFIIVASSSVAFEENIFSKNGKISNLGRIRKFRHIWKSFASNKKEAFTLNKSFKGNPFINFLSKPSNFPQISKENRWRINKLYWILLEPQRFSSQYENNDCSKHNIIRVFVVLIVQLQCFSFY